MWKRVSQVAGLLTGSGVDLVGSKSGSGVDRVGSNSRSGQKSGSGSDQVRDDVSIRFDRVENGSGQNRFDRVGQVTGSS